MDSATGKANRNSVYGCMLSMDGAVVLWFCKKPSGVWLSTVKTKFLYPSHRIRVRYGMKELMAVLQLHVYEPIPLWIDKDAAINHIDS